LSATHAELRELARALSVEALLTPRRFAWTGSSTLATYLAGATASHYRFAVKVLRRWMKTRRDGNADVQLHDRKVNN
jgi:hypothetical protein